MSDHNTPIGDLIEDTANFRDARNWSIYHTPARAWRGPGSCRWRWARRGAVAMCTEARVAR